MSEKVPTSHLKKTPVDDPVFDSYMQRLQEHLTYLLTDSKEKLFTTSVDPEKMWHQYLQGFPPAERQHYNCNACRHFIQHYGGLVCITETGQTYSPLWEPAVTRPAAYKESIDSLLHMVRHAQVTGVFYCNDYDLGHGLAGGWTHLHVTLPRTYGLVGGGRRLEVGQAMAEKRADWVNVCRFLNEYPVSLLRTAVSILKVDALDRSEKVLGQAEWLVKVGQFWHEYDREYREARLWKEVANAPAGFCHPKSSMISTLLDDLKNGLSVDEVKRRWAEKMHPLQYQRPTAAPKAQAIERAEALFKEMGLASALRRRFAKLDEVETLWQQPTSLGQPAVEGEIFGRLKRKAPEFMPVSNEPRFMTWEKFQRDVLPTAEKMEWTPGYGHHNFSQMTGPVVPDAPRLFQWNHPYCSYTYHGGTTANHFHLVAGHPARVLAIVPNVERWGSARFEHHADGVLFVLENCRDTHADELAIFPETLRSELHEVRSVIEAYSKTDKLEEVSETAQVAAGAFLGEKARPEFTKDLVFKVWTPGLVQTIRIDRWE